LLVVGSSNAGERDRVLRDALEKTQARSEELEEKVQDAAIGEAWRRKEREASSGQCEDLGATRPQPTKR